MKQRLVQLSERLFGEGRGGFRLSPESIISTVEGFFTDDDVATFRACQPQVAAELAELLEHRHHRQVVKLLVFAARDVPEPVFRPLLLAGVRTLDPSFNKHFIHPCVLVQGRRRVVATLIDMAMGGDDADKAGASAALYWGAMPRETIRWPDAQRDTRYMGPPDDAVSDLLESFQLWAVEEFLRNRSLDVRRAFVHHVAAAQKRAPSLAAAAVAAARACPDEYVHSRLRYDLGDSALIPCLPERESRKK